LTLAIDPDLIITFADPIEDRSVDVAGVDLVQGPPSLGEILIEPSGREFDRGLCP
jgi:hypothetical protein